MTYVVFFSTGYALMNNYKYNIFAFYSSQSSALLSMNSVEDMKDFKNLYYQQPGALNSACSVKHACYVDRAA